MKKLFILFVLALSVQAFSFAASEKTPVIADQFSQLDEIKGLSPEMLQLGLKQFTEITPKQYREMTGQKLGIKKTVQLKMAQHKVKKAMKKADGGDGITPGIYVLLAILGLGWFAIGMLSDWEGSDWIVNLLLTALCWLPGLIHALIKKKNYY
jgi:uncharacterized membrane protein YqaE (UPF0057 family)